METPVNHWEHSELEKLVDAKVEALQAEDKRLNERLKIVEQQTKQITDITLAVQKQSDNLTAQAKNIDSICKVQEQESARLKELESHRASEETIMEDLKSLEAWRKELEAQDGKKWRSFVKQAISFGVGIASALAIAYIRAWVGV